jgi:hypothetical protein
MSVASLLLAGTLPLALAPAPPPPAPEPGGELAEEDLPEHELGDDIVAPDPDAPEDAGADPEDDTLDLDDDVDGGEDAKSGSPTVRAPRPLQAGVIPTEGDTKPPPSDAALRREDPLAQPDRTRRDRAGRPGSPQRFALEFKVGPFLPDIDRDYAGPGLGPYATVFGRTDSTGQAVDQPKPFPMPVVAFDWQFLYLAGPLGIGVQAGFFRDKAQALLTEPMAGENLRSSADSTTFAMVPLALLLSYRLEILPDKLRVPLVPYAKAGLAYSIYWVKSGSGNIARNSRDEAGRGGVMGFQVNAGAMLRLDFLEPGTAKKLDNVTGINHTYIFGEYQLSRVNNFGAGRAPSLGDNTWFAGLAIEF